MRLRSSGAGPVAPHGAVRPLVARTVGAASGVAVWWLLGGWTGLGGGALTAALVARTLVRAEPAGRRRERARAVADMPFAADLLAAALRAGAPTEHGVRVVGTALGGILGRQLLKVADGLQLGLEPADAWAPLRRTEPGARLADAVVRSADSGAAVARSLTRLADTLRASAAGRVEAASSRLSVLLVLPLGLCFLPAFVFAGIVPVIVAELGGILR
jgi:pilus assembly protein TadC